MEVVPLQAADEEGESTTIYVKNLAFATTDAGLQVRQRCRHQSTQSPPSFITVAALGDAVCGHEVAVLDPKQSTVEE